MAVEWDQNEAELHSLCHRQAYTKTDDFVLELRQPKTEPLGGGSGTGGLHNRSLVGLVSL